MQLAERLRQLPGLRRLTAVRTSGDGIDRQLLVATLALLVTGFIAVFSATITMGGAQVALLHLAKQLFHATVGAAAGWTLWTYLPVRLLRDRSRDIALVSIGMLLLVHLPVIGVTANGASRWIDIGLFNIQPVELTKILLLAYVCACCVERRSRLQTFRGFIKPMGLVFLADVFLLLQPDFGSAVIITALALVVLFMAGARMTHFAVVLAPTAAAAAGAAYMAPYRVERLFSFIDPLQDPLDAGLQQTHALMAFGKGGWFGSGLGQSIEKWSHLPEAHTDFIYSVIAEETGLAGQCVVLALYMWILFRAYAVANRAQDRGMLFEALLARTIGLLLLVHCIINLGGNLALAPVKGITLPLLSYGGSSMVAWLVTLTLLQILAHDCGAVRPAAARYAT